MTHQEAEDLVLDLLNAQHDADVWPNKPSYQDDLEAIRRRVVGAIEASNDLLRNIAGLDDGNLYISSHAVLVTAVREWRDEARRLLDVR